MRQSQEMGILAEFTTITTLVSLPLDFGKPSSKSKEMSIQTASSIGKGCKVSKGACKRVLHL